VSRRPAVSVIVPFRGDAAAARRLRDALVPLELRAGDELIVADDSDGGVAESVLASDGPARTARVVSATGEHSSYRARNAGAQAAGGEWLLFVDADCTPAPDLIDAYFATGPADRAGVIAGQVIADTGQRAFAARYARSRRFLDQHHGLHDAVTGAAATANLLVRRTAFDRAGGFAEGVRSGGDFDLCRRLLADGWTIEARPAAVVSHLHRESPIDLLRAVARYGSGARWLNRRYPGSSPRWPLRQGLAGSARDVVVNLAHGRVEEASFRAFDGVGLVAHNVGYARSNEAERPVPRHSR
jgi:glycosyltransferase involved in cell wall biosynthesis